ncbi:putative serine/threonine-protein kinase [Nymphaea colorata]|nr:putative serine/threonine-protein kinase [Nymphaea colorata]
MWVCCFGSSQEKEKNRSAAAEHADELSKAAFSTQLYSENEMKRATNNFQQCNKIGGGGFGVVYKGILKDKMEVAIKKLSTESMQGDNEFLTEIQTISNIRHPNLVQLIGCCVQGSSRMLVYEYLENNSLSNALLAPRNKKIALGWSKRAAICIGTARGLAFLHEELEPHIVHRDIKASNILLDKDHLPKIGDFGLAKLFPDNVSHISTRVAGTIGYLAPEYALLGQLTKKADVYSFGVLLLEIISGRNVSKPDWAEADLSLLELAWKLQQENRVLEIVDEELEEYPEAEVLRFIKVALFCTQATASNRPSMTQVVEMLSKRKHLNEDLLTEPGILRKPDHLFGAKGGSSLSTLVSQDNASMQMGSAISMSQLYPR